VAGQGTGEAPSGVDVACWEIWRESLVRAEESGDRGERRRLGSSRRRLETTSRYNPTVERLHDVGERDGAVARHGDARVVCSWLRG
jgi:hypothetical protein